MEIEKSLVGIYNTLQMLDIQSTSKNINILANVYMEIESVIKYINEDKPQHIEEEN